jgi:TIR domain
MADIFISYSKSDHALALKLSAFLESEGWTVWWDKSLGAADLYRDEIMKQLAAARAVITIWTANSVKSDWVRAEAGRAKAEGKIIPVKTSELTYADIRRNAYRECCIERFNQSSDCCTTCETCGITIAILADHEQVQIPDSHMAWYRR